jgi:hypothetical protein
MSLPEQLQQSDRLDPLVWKITSVAVIGSFLSQLDATVFNVSLSTLAVELHSSLSSMLKLDRAEKAAPRIWITNRSHQMTSRSRAWHQAQDTHPQCRT